MTAADHANTARTAQQAIRGVFEMYGVNLTPVNMLDTAVAALTAQAEKGALLGLDADVILKWIRGLEKRAEAAYQALSSSQTALAEEHKRAVAAEAERDRLADALRDMLAKAMTRRTGIHADGTETWAVPLAGELAAIARATLARTEKP